VVEIRTIRFATHTVRITYRIGTKRRWHDFLLPFWRP